MTKQKINEIKVWVEKNSIYSPFERELFNELFTEIDRLNSLLNRTRNNNTDTLASIHILDKRGIPRKKSN